MICIVLLLIWNSVCIGDRSEKFSQDLPPFDFLVQTGIGQITSKTATEQVLYTVKWDFTKVEWDELVKYYNKAFSDFETLPFFTANRELKDEYLSYAGIGFYHLARAENLGNYLVKYKQQTLPYVAGTCAKDIIFFQKTELQRLKVNLEFRFSYISSTWTGASIKENINQQEVLMSFISTFNAGMTELSTTVSATVQILESLNDNIFPAHLLGEEKGCRTGKGLEGELFEIQSCFGHAEGFSCLTKVSQPLSFTKVIKYHPVSYGNIRLIGESKDHLFFKNVDTNMLFGSICDKVETLHPTCTTEEIPSQCRLALTDKRTEEIIIHCNFSIWEDAPTYVPLERGGFLIQRADNIQAGTQIINDNLPIIVYSAGVVTVSVEKKEIYLYPDTVIPVTHTVKSLVTPQMVKEITDKLYWSDFTNSIDSEDYIDYTLIGLQILALPFILYGFIKSCRLPAIRSTKNEKRKIYKENISLLRKK